MKKNMKNFSYSLFKNIALLSSLGICASCSGNNTVNKHNHDNVKSGSSKDDDETANETNRVEGRVINSVVALDDKRINIELDSEEEKVENLNLIEDFSSERAASLLYNGLPEAEFLEHFYVDKDNFVFQFTPEDNAVVLICLDEEENFEAENIDVPEKVRIEGNTYLVTNIGNNAFRKCKNIKHVNLPSSISYIGEKAFEDCENLKSVSFYENEENWVLDGKNDGELEEFREGAYKICDIFFKSNDKSKLAQLQNEASKISKIKFENRKNTLEIGKWAFINCKSLIDISLPKNVNIIIGHGAFQWCGFKSISLQGVIEIDSMAFNGCESLSNISIQGDITNIGDSAFSGCVQLESILLPNGLKEIGSWTFRSCKNLKKILLPKSLKKIGVMAFLWAGIKTISIPENVSEVKRGAFVTKSLEEIILERGSKLSDEDISKTVYSREKPKIIWKDDDFNEDSFWKSYFGKK